MVLRRCLSAATVTHSGCEPEGLAEALQTRHPTLKTGLLDGATKVYYTTALSVSKSLSDAVWDKGALYKAAVLDLGETASPQQVFHYLHEVKENSVKWLDKMEVCDREVARGLLKDALRTPAITIFTGGPSTGKSLLQKSLLAQLGADPTNTILPVRFNARGGRRFVPSIIEALSEAGADSAFKVAFRKNFDKLKAASAGTHVVGFVDVLHLLVKSAHDAKKWPVLVVDEANRFLDVSSNHSAAPLAEAKDIVDVFLQLTKEERQMSVVLATSEHAFPYNLSRNLEVNGSHLKVLCGGSCLLMCG